MLAMVWGLLGWQQLQRLAIWLGRGGEGGMVAGRCVVSGLRRVEVAVCLKHAGTLVAIALLLDADNVSMGCAAWWPRDECYTS